jgi:hypothetical protein
MDGSAISAASFAGEEVLIPIIWHSEEQTQLSPTASMLI